MKSKSLVGGIVAAAMFSSAAFAGGTATPLPAGKPAGTHRAALEGMTTTEILIAVVVGAVVITAIAGGFNGGDRDNKAASAFVNPSDH